MKHLTDHDFDVFIVDFNTLRFVYLLYFVHEVALRSLQTADAQDVMRVDRAFGKLVAWDEVHPLLDVHACTVRDSIFARLTFRRTDGDFAHALARIFDFGIAFDLSDDGMMLRFACFEQFFDTRKTLGDIVTSNTAGVERTHGELRARLADGLGGNRTDSLADLDLSLVGKITAIALDADTELRFAGQDAADGYAVAYLLDAFGKVFINHIVDGGNALARLRVIDVLSKEAANNTLSERFDDAVAFLDGFNFDTADVVVADVDFLGIAVKGFLNVILRELCTSFEDNRTIRVHDVVRDFLAVHLLEDSLARLFTLFVIRLAESDDFRNHRIGKRGFRSQRGTADHDFMDVLLANRREFLFIENRIFREQNFLRLRVKHIGAEQTAHEAVVEKLEGIERRRNEACTVLNEVQRRDIAVLFADDDVLSDVDQTAREVTRVSCTQCRIGQTFAGTMRRNEVIGYREAFTEVCRDWQVDDLTGRVSHEAAHAGELTHLLFVTAGTGVSHHEDWVEGVHVVHHGISDIVRGFRPQGDDFMITLVFRDKTAVILTLDLIDDFLRFADDGFLLRRHDDIGNSDGHAGDAGVMVTEVLDVIDDFCRLRSAKMVVAVGNEGTELLFLHENAEAPRAIVFLMEVTEFRRQDLVEDHAAKARLDERSLAVRRLHAALQGCLQLEVMLLISEKCFSNARDNHALALSTRLKNRQVVGTEHHILCRHDDWFAVFRCEDVVGCEHEDAGLCLCLCRQRQMDSHLVTIEVGVVSRAGQRMQLQGMALSEDRLEGLNAEAVQRRGTVQENRMLFDDVFEDIPYFWTCTLNHALSALDVVGSARSDELFHDKRLEELKSHDFRQAALMQLEFRADDDNGTAGIVNAFAEQVLTETALLALQHIGKGFQRAVARARDRTAAAAVIDEGIDSFLQHAFFVAHDDVRRTEV
ncbi:MAG: hypothetical protein ACFWTM_11300 [Mitsuokella multacida]